MGSADAPQRRKSKEAISAWEGTFNHPAFGKRDVNVRIVLHSQVKGRWTVWGSKIQEQTEHVFLEQSGKTWTFHDDDRSMVLEGEEQPDKSLQGVVVQEGNRGGKFILRSVDPK